MEKRPTARIVRRGIDDLSVATRALFLKLEVGRKATGLRRGTRLDEVRSAVSTSLKSFSGYASLRGGRSVYIGPDSARFTL